LMDGSKAYVEAVDIYNGASAALEKMEFAHPQLKDRIREQIATDLKEILQVYHTKFSALLVRRSQILFEAGTKLDRLN
jgi:hypothetical protein